MAFLSALASSCRQPPTSYQGYGYLIMAPEASLPAVEDFGDHKKEKGFLVDLVSLEEVLTSTPGADDPEKIRNYLKGYSALTLEREFVLLVGSMDTIPMRIAYPDPNDHFDVPTDFYYEELTGNWDADGDGFFGEYGEDMSQETEDYSVELYVARIPWDAVEQIQAILYTIIRYEEDTSPRMNRAIGAAGMVEIPCDMAPWVSLGKRLLMDPAGYESTTLYDNCLSANPDYRLTRDNFLGQWEIQEPGLVVWFSHGSSYGSYCYQPHWDTFIDVDHLPRGVAPAVCLTNGCTVAAPDVESLGRVLVRDGICASFMGSSRISEWGRNVIPSYTTQFRMAASFIGQRRAISEAKRFSLEHYATAETAPENIAGAHFHKNLFQFMVFGDPSIQLH
jgi:hypothetical protein